MSYVFITGCTGLIGSFLLRDALRQGLSVAVLLRGPRARQRLEAHLSRMGVAGAPVQIIQGDLTRPEVDLQPEDREWLAEHCDRVLHCAGVVKFQADGRSGEPYLTNLDGTRNLLNLCRRLQIRHFHHVSSAYVCGDRSGPVAEDELEAGQTFHNDYERSKFLAEMLLHQADYLQVRHIYRPSVVLGEARSGFTPSFQGAYALLLAGWVKVQQGLDRDSFLRLLNLSPGDCINLVTADWVSLVILQLMQQPSAGLRTFHLTHPHPATWANFYDALLGCAPASLQSLSGPIESDELIRAYTPYFRNHPAFVPGSHGAACPILDAATLMALARYAVESGFQANRPEPVEDSLASLLLDTPLPETRVCLEVAGQGSWSLGEWQGQLRANAQVEARLEPRAFCSSRTFHDLREGKMTVEQALYAGQMVLEGDAPCFPSAIECLSQVIQPLLSPAREGRTRGIQA